MLVIWRGFGWTVPVIVFAAFIVSQMSLDAIYGEAFYKANEWPKTAAIVVSAIVIALLGYYLNDIKRVVVVNEETGEEQKSPTHTLFFIPMEYWAIIVPALFFWVQSYSAEQDAKDLAYIESPVVNDIYHVDYTKIYEESDEKFKYGLMKVISISPEGIEVILSDMAYDQKSGVRKDIREGRMNDASYYAEGTEIFRKDDLIYLKNADGIYSVTRK